jgi:hypothetical protein
LLASFLPYWFASFTGLLLLLSILCSIAAATQW